MCRETDWNNPSMFHKRIQRKVPQKITVIVELVSYLFENAFKQFSKEPFGVICAGFQEIKENVDAHSFQKKQKWAKSNLLVVKGIAWPSET